MGVVPGTAPGTGLGAVAGTGGKGWSGTGAVFWAKPASGESSVNNKRDRSGFMERRKESSQVFGYHRDFEMGSTLLARIPAPTMAEKWTPFS